MKQLEARQPRSATQFTEVDIALALRTLALYGGRPGPAQRSLASEGIDIAKNTLTEWKYETYPVKYEAIVDELRAEIGSKVSDGAMEIAAGAADVEAMMITNLAAAVDTIPAKDLAKAALNMSQVKKSNVETARLLRNEPTEIQEVRTVDDALDTLRDLEIVVDAQEVEEE
jgi:hypothetical protein